MFNDSFNRMHALQVGNEGSLTQYTIAAPDQPWPEPALPRSSTDNRPPVTPSSEKTNDAPMSHQESDSNTIKIQESRIKNQESRIKNQESRI